MVGRPVVGAEMEYSQAVGADGRFPMSLLAPEIRATTSADAEASAGTWLDRVFAESAATHLGVSMRSVPAGVASYPVTRQACRLHSGQSLRLHRPGRGPWA